VENWARILYGREDEVPTLCGSDGDLFEVLGSRTRGARERHVLADRQVGLWGMVKWGLGPGLDMLVREKDNRMVCMPEGFWWGGDREGAGGVEGGGARKGGGCGETTDPSSRPTASSS